MRNSKELVLGTIFSFPSLKAPTTLLCTFFSPNHHQPTYLYILPAFSFPAFFPQAASSQEHYGLVVWCQPQVGPSCIIQAARIHGRQPSRTYGVTSLYPNPSISYLLPLNSPHISSFLVFNFSHTNQPTSPFFSFVYYSLHLYPTLLSNGSPK